MRLLLVAIAQADDAITADTEISVAAAGMADLLDMFPLTRSGRNRLDELAELADAPARDPRSGPARTLGAW